MISEPWLWEQKHTKSPNKVVHSCPMVFPWFSHGFLQVSRPPAAWSVTSLRRAAAFRAPPAPGRAAAPPGHEAGPGGSMRPGPGDRTGGLGGNQWYPNSWMVYDVYDGKSHENPMKMDENYRGSLGVALFQKKKQYEHTVDGRNHAPPWLKPVINRGINHLSTGARFLPSTVSWFNLWLRITRNGSIWKYHEVFIFLTYMFIINQWWSIDVFWDDGDIILGWDTLW